MKTAIKTIAIISIVIGSLAILGSLGDADFGYAFIGGSLFLAQGILNLIFIKNCEYKK